MIVWNNVDKSPPSCKWLICKLYRSYCIFCIADEWPVINKPVELIQSKENKLSNRLANVILNTNDVYYDMYTYVLYVYDCVCVCACVHASTILHVSLYTTANLLT